MKRWMLALLALGLSLPLAAGETLNNGEAAPDFALKAASGSTVKLSQFKGKTVVLEWLNEGCPFVVKHYSSGNMQALQKKYAGKDLVWLSVVSSAEGKQGHYEGPEEALAFKDEQKAHMSDILFDPDGTVGHAYGAKTTPHIFIVDAKGRLAYQGAIDDKASTKVKDIKGATNWAAQALDELAAGKAVSVGRTKPYGCSIKYAK